MVVSAQLQFPQYLGLADAQEYINKGGYKMSEILLIEEGKRWNCTELHSDRKNHRLDQAHSEDCH